MKIINNKPIFAILIALSITGSSCTNSESVIQDEASYIESIEKWQDKRLEGLKSKNGWLNLAGIYWLNEGSQTFGSDPSNDIIFPPKAQAFIGTLTLMDSMVRLEVNEEAQLIYKKEAIKTLDMEADRSENPSYVSHGDFAWYIMKRHKSLAIRLRDYKNPAIEALDHMPSYPIEPEYVIEAKLHTFDSPKTITVNTPFQDYTQEYKCPGELHFKLRSKNLKLLPFTSEAGYFIIISDETSGMETYGGGRFLYASPDSTGRIVLDFNKAYNPPCAITEFAACPLPPKENYLPLKIEAGEKAVGRH